METVLCEKPDHAEMPKHYHMAGEFEARLKRLEEFKSRVEKAVGEVGGLPSGFKQEITDAAKEVDS